MPAFLPPTNYTETKSQKFRRLLIKADLSNPLNQPVLIGATPWTVNTYFIQNQVVSNQAGAYVCTQTGSSSLFGPSGRLMGQIDGTCTWDYIGPQTAPQITLASAAPAWVTANGQTISYNDPRIRVLGCATPFDNGNGYFFPTVNGGLGGKGNGVLPGSTAGQPLTTGYQQDHFGTQICTDAPVIVFQTSNAGWSCNFLVEQNGRRRFVAAKPFTGTTSFTNFWVVDFTQVTDIASFNGPQVAPGSGAVFTPVMSGSAIASIIVNNGGWGYSQSDLPTIIAYGGTLSNIANLIPVVNSAGQITNVLVEYGGLYGGTPTVIAQTGRAKRIVTLETGETMRVANIYVGAMDTVWAIPTTDRVRAACFGDSWVEGFTQSDSARRLAQADVFCHLMGWDDCISSGQGGCGWTVPMVPYSGTVSSGAFNSGLQTITLNSFNATNGSNTNYSLVPGMSLTFGTGTANVETVQLATVNIGSSQVSATFTFNHPANEVVTGYLNKLQTSTIIMSGPVTGSASPQSVSVASLLTPSGTVGIASGNSVYFDPLGPNPEVATVTSVAGSSFTVTLSHNHAASSIVLGMAQTFNIGFAQRYTDIAFPDSAQFKNKSTNTGNGSCNTITISSSRVPGNYTFTAISSGIFTALDGTGVPLSNLVVGTPYTGGGLTFTISQGSTGYVVGDQFYIYVTAKPDVIVICPCGINDASATASSGVIAGEVTKMYNSIRSVLPTTPIIWFGCQGLNTTTALAVEVGTISALNVFNSDPDLLFVPVQTDNPSWLTTNNNKGYYINPALGHPTDQGYLYQGQHMQNQQVRNFLAAASWLV